MKKFLLIACVLVLTVSFAMPAMAATKVGGILFSSIFWMNRDAERQGKALDPATYYNVDSNSNVHVFNCAHSRFYVRWTTDDDTVGLYLEQGIGGGDGAKNEGMYTRHYYGWWNVNPTFTLKVGMTTSPVAPLNAHSLGSFGTLYDSYGVFPGAYAILAGHGNIYIERAPQIRGEFNFGPHFLRIAIVDWRNTATTPSNIGAGNPGVAIDGIGTPLVAEPGTLGVSEETSIPRLDVGAKLQLGPVALYPGFVYLSRDFEEVRQGDDNSVDTYLFSVGATASFGPFTLTGEFNMGQNWGDAGLLSASAAAGSFASKSQFARNIDDGTGHNKIYNTDCMGYFIDLAWKWGVATPHFFWGQNSSENDEHSSSSYHFEYKTTAYGVSVPIAVAKGFIIRPELKYYDEGDVEIGGAPGVDAGTTLLYGVNFQITF